MLLSINQPASCLVLCIHPVIQPCVHTHLCLAISPWLLPDFIHSSIHLHPPVNLSATPPIPKTYKFQPSAYLFTFPSIHTFIHLSPRHQSFPLKHLCPQPSGSLSNQSKSRQGKASTEKALPYLEEDLSCHGEAVGDDGLLVRGPAFPAVQLHAAAAGQQRLAVHFGRGRPRKLPSCRREAQC